MKCPMIPMREEEDHYVPRLIMNIDEVHVNPIRNVGDHRLRNIIEQDVVPLKGEIEIVEVVVVVVDIIEQEVDEVVETFMMIMIHYHDDREIHEMITILIIVVAVVRIIVRVL
jgi:hypothetical protein